MDNMKPFTFDECVLLSNSLNAVLINNNCLKSRLARSAVNLDDNVDDMIAVIDRESQSVCDLLEKIRCIMLDD